LLLTVIGGIITGFVAIYNSYIQAKQAHQLEQDKLRSSLILKAIEYPDAEERKKALKFYVETGLLSDADGKIAAIKPESIPQAPLSSRQFGEATYVHFADAVMVQSGFYIDLVVRRASFIRMIGRALTFWLTRESPGTGGV